MEAIRQSIYFQLFFLKEFLPTDLSLYCAWFLCWTKLTGKPLFSLEYGKPNDKPVEWAVLQKHWAQFRGACYRGIIAYPVDGPVDGTGLVFGGHRLEIFDSLVRLFPQESGSFTLGIYHADSCGRWHRRDIREIDNCPYPQQGAFVKVSQLLSIIIVDRAELFLTDPRRALEMI